MINEKIEKRAAVEVVLRSIYSKRDHGVLVLRGLVFDS